MRRTSSYQDTAAAASQSARTSSSDEDEELARLRQARRSFASATVDIETSPSTCAAPTSKASSLRKSTASSLSPRFSPPNFLSICGLNKSADQDNTLMYKRSYSDTTDDTAASLDSLSSAKSSTISTTPPSPPMQLYNKLRGRSPVRRIQITLPARCSSSEPSSGTSSPPEDDSATFPESVDHRAKTSGTLKFLKRAARPT